MAERLHKEPLTFEYVKPTQTELQVSYQLPVSSFQLLWGYQSYRAQVRGTRVPLKIEALAANRYLELEAGAGSWKLFMRINLKVWRQAGPNQARPISLTTSPTTCSPDMSFLEMLDVVNEALIVKGEDPIAFDSDCREGICGTCGFLVERHSARAGSRARPYASCTCAASRTATR